MLTKEAIAEFKELWKAHYGDELTDEGAFEKAQNLMNIARCLNGFVNDRAKLEDEMNLRE